MAKGTTKSSERAAGAETRCAPEGQTSRPAPAPLGLPAEAPEPQQGGRRAAGSSPPPLPHGESTLSFVCRPAPPRLILTYIPGTQRISAELLSAQKRGQTAHRRAAASALTALPEPCTRGVLREGSQRGERGQKPQAPHRAGPGHRKSCREQDPLRRVSQPPKTTAKAAERFFSAQILLSGSLRTLQPGCPRCPVGRQLRMLALKSPGSVSGAVHADTPSAACPSTQTFPPRCSCAAAQPGPPRTCPAGLWGRRAVLQTCERGDVSTFPVGPLPPSSRRSGCSSLQLLPQGKYLESSRHSSSQEQVKHWPDNNSKCL